MLFVFPSGFGQYERGGVVQQVKQPKVVSFKPMPLAMKEMEPVLTDFAKFEAPGTVFYYVAGKSFALKYFFIRFSLGLLHACYQTLHSWNSSHPAPPKPWSSADAEEFLSLAKKDYGDLVTNDEYVTQFAKICAGEVNPMCASVGGVVGQEVMKACSGKFMPIYQWFYFDAIECLPEDCSSLTEENCAPSNNRYRYLNLFIFYNLRLFFG